MRFKIKNTTYEISFTFLATILFILTVSKNENIFFMLIFAVLHEIVHLIFIYTLSVPPERVSFNLFGANILRGMTTSSNLNSEIIINASAPVFNIFTGAVFYLFSKLDTQYNLIFMQISNVNIVLGFFNFLPYYTFDGGNVLKNILLKYLNEKAAEQVLTCVSLAVTMAFTFISIHIFFNYKHNFLLFFMCIYMFLSIIFKK